MTDKITNTPSLKTYIIKEIFQILLLINIKINTTGVGKGHRTLYCNYSCISWRVVGGTNEKLLKQNVGTYRHRSIALSNQYTCNTSL